MPSSGTPVAQISALAGASNTAGAGVGPLLSPGGHWETIQGPPRAQSIWLQPSTLYSV